MPDAIVAASATPMSDEAAGFAVLTRRLVAGELDERLLHTEDSDMGAMIALAVGGAAEELARARKLVSELQACRAEIARTCAAMRETLKQ